MKYITLNRGKRMQVDNEDYPLLSRYKWHVYKNRYRFYARTEVSGGHCALAHRLIMNPKKRELIDHKDMDGLNNQKCNLRKCTMAQNNQNSSFRRHNKSGYRGVMWHKRTGAYYCRVRAQKKEHWIGIFDDPIKAAHAYDKKAKEVHGEFAVLNFPQSRAV